MKAVKNDWHIKFSEESIEAFLLIKAEGPEIRQFTRGNSSDVGVFW